MAQEIERKFLVVGDDWKKGAVGKRYRQGYLNSVKERTVRIRTIDDKAFLAVKGIKVDCTRLEFEYPIPLQDCNKMLDDLAERPIIEKTRYKIDAGNGLTWEIDEFYGANEGLVVAEIEVPTLDTKFDRPSWLGKEVSDDPRYFNSNLLAHPYSSWEK